MKFETLLDIECFFLKLCLEFIAVKPKIIVDSYKRAGKHTQAEKHTHTYMYTEMCY